MLFHGLILCILTVRSSIVECHIVLTFPPARPFAFDFLDNIRTEGPCGMKYNADHRIITTLVAGQEFEVTWHLAYPHVGGIKLQLLDLDGNVTMELTNDRFVFQNDSTKQSYDVTIDGNITCEHCILRIIKQAHDWSKRNQTFLFWSCADISLIDEEAAENSSYCFEGQCSNRGTCDDGKCTCRKQYDGHRCQFENDCYADDECGHGKCVERNSSSYPRKMCFCDLGWMGRFCNVESSLETGVLNKTEDYHKIVLCDNPRYELFWQLVDKDEIEVALRVQTNTWLAIGWRPQHVTSKCKEFPQSILPEPDEEGNLHESNERKEHESRRKRSETEQNNELPQHEEVNVVQQLCEAGKTEEAAEYVKKRFKMLNRYDRNEPSPESEADTKATSSPEPNTEPEIKAETTTGVEFPEAKTSPTAEITPEVENGSEPAAEPEPEVEPEPEPEVYPETYDPDQLHAMDCTDIVVVMVDEERHHVVDSYAKDRSTPQPDHWYGGTNDLKAAAAQMINGTIHARFRRKLISSDMSDHSIFDSTLHLIWARGQTSSTFYHQPFSGLETCKASNYEFYRKNELKYHGTSPLQRGSRMTNFYDVPQNQNDSNYTGSYDYPPGCVGDECDYRASWSYREKSKNVHFELEAKVNEEEWIAIGFSEDKNMINSDAIVGWVSSESGEATVTDLWLADKTPEGVTRDSGSTSLRYSSGFYREGRLNIVFTRSQDTKDDNDISLTKCVYFLYAWGGGFKDGHISMHKNKAVSQDMICLGSLSSTPTQSHSLLLGGIFLVLNFVFLDLIPFLQ